MRPNIISLNKSALSFSEQAIPRIKELCRPLKEYLNISCFGYLRIYNNCTYISLMNGHEEYHKKYFETITTQDNQFLNFIRRAPLNECKLCLWPTQYEKMPPIISLHNEFNIWHGFSINYRYQEFIEVFSFAFDKNSDDKSLFYFENSQLLVKFCDYIKNNIGDLIHNNEIYKLGQFVDIFDFSYSEVLDNHNIEFINAISKHKRYPLKNKNGNIVDITKRELDCITILMQNKTSKEIGNLLNISHRTVESHISNVKRKLEVNYKNQLIDIFYNPLK